MHKNMTHPNFVKPRYDTGGFASLPGRVSNLLTARRYDAVVLLLLDGFGWRFITQFYVTAGISALIMRFALYWPLKGWLVTGNAPWGLPEVSLLWVVSSVIGLAITWILFTIIHLAVNRIINGNAPPVQDAINLPPVDTTQP